LRALVAFWVKSVTYRSGPEQYAPRSGPEQYAPPNRRPVEPGAKTDQVLKSTIAGNVHELVPRADSPLNQEREVNDDKGWGSEDLNALIQRIAGSSINEIDRVISELEAVREILRNEGERVSREIAGYAGLSGSATTVMKVIGDSIKQWRNSGNATPRL
jgi:hypothetical protein